jgi:hypothetical protein
MQVPFIISGDGDLNIVFQNKQYQVKKDYAHYAQILKILAEEEYCTEEEFAALLSPEKTVAKHLDRQLGTDLKIANGLLTYQGYEIHGVAVDRLFEFIEKGLPTKPLENFLANICQNPSRRSAESLYGFLEHQHLPITPDGCFLAYKAVTWDYKSKHTGPDGQLDNSIGSVVRVPRNRVDDNHSKDCSYGLHAGNLKYVEFFGNYIQPNPDRVVIVKINPKDVVSVPDYHTDKLRCCEYIVVGDHNNALTEPVHNENQTPYDPYDPSGLLDEDDMDEDYDEDDEDDEDEWEEEEDVDDTTAPQKPVWPFNTKQ